jgi:hypothetical protein
MEHSSFWSAPLVGPLFPSARCVFLRPVPVGQQGEWGFSGSASPHLKGKSGANLRCIANSTATCHHSCL